MLDLGRLTLILWVMVYRREQIHFFVNVKLRHQYEFFLCVNHHITKGVTEARLLNDASHFMITIMHEFKDIHDIQMTNTLGTNVMESLLVNGICVNLIDQYLLFLVICSIAEWNTVDFIDPLRNQIEWPNTISIVWGPLRLKRRKIVSSGVATSSEVCLAITTLMLLCSVGFR